MIAQAQTPESCNFGGQKIIVAGTGDTQMLLRALGRAFEAKYAGSEIEVPDSIGSSGGIKALAVHRNTIGFLPISAIKGTDLKIVESQ